MTDLQRLVDEIRFQVQSDECELTDGLRQLAADYCDVCREVNARLRRCGEFLKQGLRAEAIHLAEAEPRLLDLLSTIDLPEREQFTEILTFYLLGRPEPLLIDVAEQLNEAYALQQPLEKLLDRHRLLALGRAPLSQRLAVIRQLARLDPEATFWEEDQQTFERARILEIDRDARTAAAQGDAGTLQSLREELVRNDWLEQPSRNLVQTVKRLGDELERNLARLELEELEPALNEAFAAMDRPLASELRRRWQAAETRAGLTHGDPLRDQVGPVLDWLADQDRLESEEQAYAKATATLERLLDDSQTEVTELQSAWYALQKFERGAPDLIAQRYHTRVQSVHVAARRHQRLVVGSAIACLLLVVGILGLIGYRSMQATQVERLTKAIDQLIEAQQLEEARQLLTRNEHLSSWEAWLNAQQQLVEAEQREQDRRQALEVALAGARRATAFSEAKTHLTQARETARTSDEKLEVVRLEDTWQQRHLEQRAQDEQHFRTEIVRLADLVLALERAHTAGQPGAGFTQDVRGAESSINALKPLLTGVGTALGHEWRLLESRIAALKRMTADLERREQILSGLAESALIRPGLDEGDSQLLAYSKLLDDYSKRFSSEGRARDFQTVSAELEMWRGTISGQLLFDTWKPWQPVDGKSATERLQKCQAWLKSYDQGPTATTMRAYQDYLQAVLARDMDASGDETNGLRSRLEKLFSGPMIDSVHCLETNDGVVYYLSTPTQFQKRLMVNFQYLVGFTGETKPKTLAWSALKFERTHPAPQSDLARMVQARVPELATTEWNTYLLSLARSIRDNEKLDPFLRYYLLVRTLEAAAKGDAFLQPEVEPLLARLRDENIDLFVKWMNPDDPAAQEARQRSDRVLGLVASKQIDEAWERAHERESRLETEVREKILAVGCLIREGANWNCRTVWKPRVQHRLYIAVPAANGRVGSWSVVGTADPQRGIALDLVATGQFKEGRLVFASSGAASEETASND